MKRKYLLLISLLLLPVLNTYALTCYQEGKTFDPKDKSFTCTEVEGDTLTFKQGDNDYKDYFTYEIINNEKINKKANVNVNENIVFDASVDKGVVEISDGKGKSFVSILNPAYIPPTTTTTTIDPNLKVYTVTLDLNDSSGKKETRTCNVTNVTENYCQITLPTLEDKTFSGWGTARTCKEGNEGVIKVEKDVTYYACYTSNTITEDNGLALRELNIKDVNDKNINFGKFSEDTFEYNFKVLNDVKSLNIEAIPIDSNTKITITGNEALNVGENKILIVLSNTTDTKEYTLTVTRLKEGETIDTTHYLESLVIGGYNISFDKNKFDYNITIDKNINKLELTTVPEDDDLEVEILNNDNLQNGSVVEINVIGSDEEITTYRIHVSKSDSSFLLMISAIAVIGVLIVALVIVIIIKSKSKGKKDNSKKQPKSNKKSKSKKKNAGPELLGEEDDLEVFKI